MLYPGAIRGGRMAARITFAGTLRAALLLPFLLLCLMPPGAMAHRGDRGMEVVLCTGHGPVTVMLDEDGKPIVAKASTAPCDWAVHGQPWLADDTAALAPPHTLRLSATHVPLPLPARLAARPKTHPARAPPLLL